VTPLLLAVVTIQQWRSLPQFSEPSVAYRVAKEKGLQGRMLWIDGTANIGLVADRSRLDAFMKKAREVGFNTVVYDVKPIIGRTLYPSQFAAPLTSWRGQAFPPGYNPLAEVLRAGHAAGLKVCVSMNAFSEGHRYAKEAAGKPGNPYGDPGPGYRWPERQTSTVRFVPCVKTKSGSTIMVGKPPYNELSFSATKPSSEYRTIRQDGVVAGPDEPNAVGYLFGDAGLQEDATGGKIGTTYRIAPSSDSQNQIPLMMNPHDKLVQDHILVMVDEVARHYPIDGLLFDDRLRYAGLEGDFSESTRKAFEARIGGSVKWFEDIYTVVFRPDLTSFIKPGKYFNEWLAFRAETISAFVKRSRQVLKRARPSAAFGVYAGSTYGHYYKFGNNYGSPDNRGGFPFLTADYRKAGFAHSLDLLVTGCYYPTPTIADALASDRKEGFTVEAGALVSAAAAYDATWTYAGVMLTDYKGRPEALETALRAAVDNTEGVMVFDASHGIDDYWPVFAKVFAKPARAPHTVPGLIDQVRRARAQADRRGKSAWNFPMLEGQADAGF